MKKSNYFRKKWTEESGKLKNMTFKQKYDYIWSYYKLHILSTIAAIGIIITVICTIAANNYKTVYTAIIVDGKLTGIDDHTDILTKEFTSYLGIDGKSHRVLFNNNFNINSSDSEEISMSIQKITVMSVSSEADGFLCDLESISYFLDEDDLFLCDLSQYLTPDELTKLENDLVYFTSSDGEKIPIAVNMSSTHIKTDTDLSMSNPCYGIVSSGKNKENAAQFIRYAFGL